MMPLMTLGKEMFAPMSHSLVFLFLQSTFHSDIANPLPIHFCHLLASNVTAKQARIGPFFLNIPLIDSLFLEFVYPSN